MMRKAESAPLVIAGSTGVCTRCGQIGAIAQVRNFNLLVFALLLCMGLVPGLLYCVWCAHRADRQICVLCGSDALVAARTPLGRSIIACTLSANVQVQERPRVPRLRAPVFGRATAIVLALLSAPFFWLALRSNWSYWYGAWIGGASLAAAFVLGCAAWTCFFSRPRDISGYLTGIERKIH